MYRKNNFLLPERTFLSKITMIVIVILLLMDDYANGQASFPRNAYQTRRNPAGNPKPYIFQYIIQSKNGIVLNSRRETSDGTGQVEGSYSVRNEEGHFRIVTYIADKNGFRPFIRTNEPGVGKESPADVTLQKASGANFVIPNLYPHSSSNYTTPEPARIPPEGVYASKQPAMAVTGQDLDE